MTFSNKKNTHRLHGTATVGIVSAIAFVLFLLRSDIAIEYMKKGLKLCSNTVIPSLFPFMVISELLVRSGLAARVSRAVSKPVKKLFGVSEGGACAFVLGLVCGFPIGAKTVSTMLERNEITKKEAERSLTFCNNPGSAFVVSAVGVSLFGNFALGITLYICVILSAAVVGAVGRLFIGKKAPLSSKKTSNAPPYAFPHDPLKTSPDNPHNSDTITKNHNSAFCAKNSALSYAPVALFTSAIQSSATSMLTVCALVAFFSSLVGTLGAVLQSLGATEAVIAVIFAFFELSSGVGMAAELPPTAAILLTSAALGWSGLSVHFQVMSVCSGHGISFKPYFIAKFCQGIVCSALTALALRLFPLSEETFAQISDSLIKSRAYSNAAFVCIVFFAAAICGIFLAFFGKNSTK